MAVDITKLVADREAAIAAGQAIIKTAIDAGEDLTDEQFVEVEAHADKAKELKAAIDRANKQAALVATLADQAAWGSQAQARVTTPPTPAPEPAPTHVEITGGRDATRFGSFGEQLCAIRDAASAQGMLNIDPRLNQAAITGSGTTIGSEGGFLVQEDYASEILRLAHSGSQIVSRVRKIPIGANSDGLTINVIAESSRATGSRWGGVQVYRKAQGAQGTASKPTLRQVKWSLKKLFGLWYATDELLADSTAMENIAQTAFSEEIAFVIEDEIINGDGASQMKGILNSQAMVTVAKESGQAAKTIEKENIDKMFSRCWAPSRMKAIWLYNQDIEPQLFSMTQDVGTGGVPVYLPPGGTLANSPYGSLYGLPTIPVEHCQTLGTKGDLLLVDLTQYIMIEKGGVKADSSIHLRFDYDETVFRWIVRNDGQTPWDQALTTAHGGASTKLSPFIALATR